MEIFVMLAGAIYIGLLGFQAMEKLDEFVEQGGFSRRECERNKKSDNYFLQAGQEEKSVR